MFATPSTNEAEKERNQENRNNAYSALPWERKEIPRLRDAKDWFPAPRAWKSGVGVLCTRGLILGPLKGVAGKWRCVHEFEVSLFTVYFGHKDFGLSI